MKSSVNNMVFKRNIAIALSFLATLISFVAGTGTSSALYTAAQIDARVPSASADFVARETACRGDLAAERANGGTDRSNVNDSNPYRRNEYVSERSRPNDRTITYPYGSTSPINLQLNQNMFICAIIVDPWQGSDNLTNTSSTLTSGTFPNDRRPNPDPQPGTGATVNSASLLGINTQVTSYRVSSGGGSAAGLDTEFNLVRDNNSRYWFSPANNFTYTPPSPVTADINVTMEFVVRAIHTYTGGVDRCSGVSANLANNRDFANCSTTTRYVSFRIDVGAAPTATVNGIKVTNAGGDTRNAALDAEVVTLSPATGGTTRNTNPFFFNTQPTAGTRTISVPDKVGWTVVGTAFCDQQVTTDGCASMIANPAAYAGYNAAGNGKFQAGRSRVFGPLTANHTYAFRIIYRPIPPVTATWTIVPTTSVDRFSARPGETVYFEHLVNNNSGKLAPAAGWNYQILSSTGTGGQGSTGGQNLNPGQTEAIGANFGFSRTYTIPNGTPDGTRICQAASVNPSQEGTTNTATAAEVCVVVSVGPPPPAPGCAGLPDPSSAYVDVALPHQDVSDAPPATQYSDNANSSDREQVPYAAGGTTNKETEVTIISDISSGGDRTPPTQASEAYQTVKLDYTPYIASYPYDFNQPSVTYDSFYSERTWTTDNTPDRYECRTAKPNMTGQGTATCSYNYPAYNNYQCDSGSSGGGSSSTCTRYTAGTYNNHPYCSPGSLSGSTCTYGASGASPSYTCPSGGSGGGTSSSCTYTAYDNYYYDCPAGWSGGGGSSTCYQDYTSTTNNRYCDASTGDYVSGSTCYGSYSATPMYEWVAGPWDNRKPTPNTVNGTQMTPCFDRKFDFESSVFNAQLDDVENPTSVEFSYRVEGPMFADEQPANATLRDGMEVNNLARNGSYYYVDENGARRTGDQPFSAGSRTYSSGNTSKRYQLNDSEQASVPVTRGSGGPLAPALGFGWRVCFKTALPEAIGEMNTVGAIAGGATNFDSPPPDECSDPVGNRPYFRVYGGDIQAGGEFENNGVCNSTTEGRLLGQYRSSTSVGAGTELAAVALRDIQQVVSADLRTTFPTLQTGLSFANFGVGGMGGNFSSRYCATDYFGTTQFNEGDTRRNPGTGSISPGDINVAGLSEGGQTVVTVNGSGRLRLNMGGAATTLRHTIYVTGDVIITEDIIYPTGNTTNLPAFDRLPYLTVVVRGNIFIEKDVSQLDGLYIAQRNGGAGGRIMTCRDNNGGFIAPPDVSANCTQKLIVNGAFVANEIYLQRSIGTLSTGTAGERANSNNIAEVFQGTPEFYIGRPVFKSTTGLYDSVRMLPPIL